MMMAQEAAVCNLTKLIDLAEGVWRRLFAKRPKRARPTARSG